MVSVNTPNASVNFGLSRSPTLRPRSCSAVLSEYGVVVRPNGIDVTIPVPAGAISRAF